MTDSKKDSMKGMFNSFLSKAQTLGKSAVETAKDTGEKVRDVVEERVREYNANEIYRKLGKKVYKLVSRDELSLPECCDKYIEALNDLYDEEDERDDSVEQEACKCECKCDGDKCECKCDGDKCECKCDGKSCDCDCGCGCGCEDCKCPCEGDICECKCCDHCDCKADAEKA